MKPEPLKKEDMIRGVIVNADEYKSDETISPNKIEEVWINLENHKSAVEWLKEEHNKTSKKLMDYVRENKKIDIGFIYDCVSEFFISDNKAFPDLGENK